VNLMPDAKIMLDAIQALDDLQDGPIALVMPALQGAPIRTAYVDGLRFAVGEVMTAEHVAVARKWGLIA
jgi:hypothetical protein